MIRSRVCVSLCSRRSGMFRVSIAIVLALLCVVGLVMNHSPVVAAKEGDGDRKPVSETTSDQPDIASRIIELPVNDASITEMTAVIGESDGNGGSTDGGCPPVTVGHSSHNFISGPFTAQGGFVETEIAAVTYTLNPAEFPIRVDRVDGLFGTQTLQQQITEHWTMMVWEGEPATGTLICVAGPCTIASDGDIVPHIVLGPPNNAIQVQAMVDPGDPDQIIVTNNGSNKFSVGFQINQMNQDAQSSCNFTCTPPQCCPPPAGLNVFPTTDGGMSQPTANWLMARSNCGICAAPGGWYTSQEAGITGDWIIRATYSPTGCVTPTGSCCVAGGSQCFDGLTAAECAAQSGSYQGDGSTCALNPCPIQTGRCCLPSGSCTVTSVTSCSSQGGTFLGSGTCNADTCKGACCVPSTQQCVFATQANCTTAGGVFQGIGVQCAGTCFGACCLPNGSCVQTTAASNCTSQGGTYQGGGTSCGTANCPQPTGACCIGGTNCATDLSEDECEVGFGGQWLGAGSTCDFNPCSPLGACCLGTSCLSDLTQTDCTSGFGGTWQGAGSTCSPTNPCSTPSCPADVAPPGGNGSVGAPDLLFIINNWGPCPTPPAQCPADVVPNGSVGAADLLFIINEWGPC